MALLLDIFANFGVGADLATGPTTVVRKELVRSFKQHFQHLVVVEAIRNKDSSKVMSVIDPNGLSKVDPDTFLVWVEISVGVVVDTFYNAGGHFGNTIISLRKGRNVVSIPRPLYCETVLMDQHGHAGGNAHAKSSNVLLGRYGPTDPVLTQY